MRMDRLCSAFIDFLLTSCIVFVFSVLGIALFKHFSTTPYFDLSLHKNVETVVQRYLVYNAKGHNYYQTHYPQYVHEQSDIMSERYEYYIQGIGNTHVKEEFRNDITNYYPDAKYIGTSTMSYAIMDIPDKEVDRFLEITQQMNIPIERMIVLNFGGMELDFRESLVPLILNAASSHSLAATQLNPLTKAERKKVIDYKFIFSCLLVFFYSIICLLLLIVLIAKLESSKWQGTLGKLLFSLKVVDNEGNRLTYSRAFIRGLYRALSIAMLFTGYLYIFGKDRKCLHDIWSKTIVVDI